MQDRLQDQLAHPSIDNTPRAMPSPGDPGGRMPDRPVAGGGVGAGPAEANAPPSYVFALGRIEPRSPSLAVEKEFAQSTGRAEMAGLTDRQALQRVLSERRNRYLLRQLCWVLTIEGLETYLLMPRDPLDFDLLVEALRPAPRPTDVDLVIGIRGPVASPQACNGLAIPMVAFDQIYSFDVDELVASIPKPERMADEAFRPAAEELLNRIMQLADNAGTTDEHRALNYLAVRYPPIYETAVDRYAENYSLASVEVRPSRLSGIRKIVDVVFSFISRNTGVVEESFVRVDVTEEFPFLVTRMSPFLQTVR